MTPCSMDPAREQQAHAPSLRGTREQRSAKAREYYQRRLRCAESKRRKLIAERIVQIRKPRTT